MTLWPKKEDEHDASNIKPHICPPALTPAAQAVLEAAVRWAEHDERGTGLQAAYDNLKDAIRRYRETLSA